MARPPKHLAGGEFEVLARKPLEAFGLDCQRVAADPQKIEDRALVALARNRGTRVDLVQSDAGAGNHRSRRAGDCGIDGGR